MLPVPPQQLEEVSSTSALLSTVTIEKVFPTIPSNPISTNSKGSQPLLSHLSRPLARDSSTIGLLSDQPLARVWEVGSTSALLSVSNGKGFFNLSFIPQTLVRDFSTSAFLSISTIDKVFLNLCALFYPKHRRGLPLPLLF